MPKVTQNQLTSRFVETIKKPGWYVDGQGLRLQVTPEGAKSWVLRFTRDGKTREMGLGPHRDVSLADARERARKARQQILDGVDPIAAREESRTAAKVAEAKHVTFEDCASKYIKAHKAGWKNAKHAEQWHNTLRDYAFPVLGSLPVSKIDTPLVLKVIEPIWHDKTETASRIRARIENILDWATVRGYRTGDNPARWRGHLDHTLPKRSKVARVKHHPALPFTEMGAFMEKLREQPSTSSRALELIILTAARTNEALQAEWGEVDMSAKVWTIPAERMKTGKEHKVPLSDAALTVLRALKKESEDEFVFPGQNVDAPLSNMACLKVLERMNGTDDSERPKYIDKDGRPITVHGFRSTFRDWAAELTSYPRDVVEMALAHTIDDKVEAAYRRGDLFEKRRRLMAEWARYCAEPQAQATGKVVALKGKR